MSAPFAAIDIGTNTVLCLVARRGADGELEILDDACATARLGTGLARTGLLEEASLERTLGLLEAQLTRARALGVERIRAVGTAVLRRAKDAERFLEACRVRLELEVEVLPEAEEARLGHAGAVGLGRPDAVVLDVGGGSTEVVTNGGSDCLSAPVGAVVLTERFLGLDGAAPLEEGGLGALVAAVAEAVSCFPAGSARGKEVVLIGGTAVNLGCLDLGLASFDPVAAEGHALDARAPARFAEAVAMTPLGERGCFPIEPDRHGILPAGLTCIAGSLRRLEADRARVTTRGLRHGVAAQLGADS